MELPFSDIVNIIVVPWRIVLQTIDRRVNESLRETIHREEHLDEKILISHSNKFANQLQLREDKTCKVRYVRDENGIIVFSLEYFYYYEILKRVIAGN